MTCPGSQVQSGRAGAFRTKLLKNRRWLFTPPGDARGLLCDTCPENTGGPRMHLFFRRRLFLHNKIGKKIQQTQATTTRAQRRLGCRLVLGSKQVTLRPSRQPGEGAWQLPTTSIEISCLGTWRPLLSPFFTPIHAPYCFANTPGPVLPLGLCPCCSLYL